MLNYLKIVRTFGREVLDSRGNPTVEAIVVVKNEMTGELFCCNCKGAGAGAYPLEVITAMRHSVFSEFDKMFSLQLSADNIPRFAYASEKYLMSVIRRKFRTLDFYKTMINE